MLRLVCDENIAITGSLLALASTLERLPGRDITRAHLQQADALLVRSITSVNSALLMDTSVRFVGTATAGIDHVDTAALDALGITFANAPGANANAVAEYVLAALCELGLAPDVITGLRVGIVGLGAVGERVARMLIELGACPIAYDPLRSRWPDGIARGTLPEVLSQPVVTLHAGLHDGPKFPSRHLLNEDSIRMLPPKSVLINAGRGALVTVQALFAAREKGCRLVLDTWPEEPDIAADLLAEVALATPHIAGYSVNAKQKATERLVEAMSRVFPGLPSRGHALDLAPEWPLRLNNDQSEAAVLASVVRDGYDIAADDRTLRQAATIEGVTGVEFDRLRRHYPLRHEMRGRMLAMRHAGPNVQRVCAALGLRPEIREEQK